MCENTELIHDMGAKITVPAQWRLWCQGRRGVLILGMLSSKAGKTII